MTTSPEAAKSNQLPPSLVANLQSVLLGRKAADGDAVEAGDPKPPEEAVTRAVDAADSASPADGSEKPVVLVTNADGIRSPGLAFLVDALVRGGLCDVNVCAPDSDKSASGHSITVHETLAVNSAEFPGARAFEVSGTPVDCVSLALSGALFSWSRPALVICGINRGLACGHQTFYSGGVAAVREALLCGVPSLAISLDWKKGESQEVSFKDAVDVCMLLIHAAIRDVEKGFFPKRVLLNIAIPSLPSTNKGFKLTRQSLWRYAQNWHALPANRNPAAAQFMSAHQSLGIQLAQLGRDASAAGAARRLNAQRKTVEIESVAVVGKPESREAVKKCFRLEFLEKEYEDLDEDIDLRAVENGFISITPLCVQLHVESELQASASDWLASALAGGKEAP